jgi:hypothetical protein
MTKSHQVNDVRLKDRSGIVRMNGESSIDLNRSIGQIAVNRIGLKVIFELKNKWRQIGHSQRVKLSELRKVMRLVREVCEVGEDTVRWRNHLLKEFGDRVGS